MSLRHDCTEACEASPKCTVCGMHKAPRGRSVPMEMSSGYCPYECSGNALDPRPGHLWPGEIAREKRDEEERAAEAASASKRYIVYCAEQYPPLEHIAVGIDAARVLLAKVRANHPGEVVLCAAEDCEGDEHRGLTPDEREILQ